jgi:fucose permease
MSKRSPKLTFLLTTAAFYAFFVFGYSDNLKGPTLPAVLDELHLSYALGGTILFGAYVGFLLATLLTGLLADATSKKMPLLVAGLALSLGIWGYSSANSPLILTLMMVVFGFGLGSIELGANALIVDLHDKQRGLLLNMMAVFHGAGSMLAPLAAGRMLAAETSWRSVYQWDWALVGGLLLLFLLLPYPRTRPAVQERPGGQGISRIRQVALTPEMGWFYFAQAIYVAAELGIASWIVEFLQKTRGQTVETSTAMLSLFFLTVTAGRFVGSFIIERVGYLRSVLIAALGAGICVALGVFGPVGWELLLPFSGLFLSIIFPTLTAEVTVRHEANMGLILGLLFAFAGLGGMFGPWLIGVAADALHSIQWGFGVTVIYCVLLAGATLVIIKRFPIGQK